MKNFLAYTNPRKDFDDETKQLVRLHIDNSYDLGWKEDDILLFTNFPYEYNGVRAIEVSDELHMGFDKTSNKVLVINYLLNHKLLSPDLYWYHDFDAYQNNVITEEELGLDGFEVGLTGYGYKNQCNGGSFFFRDTSRDFFQTWVDRMAATHPRTRTDEKTMTDLTYSQLGHIEGYKYLNITYNFGMRKTDFNYAQATQPLKVLHFHPNYNDIHLPFPTLQTFMYGKNPMGIPLMSDRLIKIFNHHGIQ